MNPSFECPICQKNKLARFISRSVGGKVAECALCGHLTLWPLPSDEEIASWYEKSELTVLKECGTALFDNRIFEHLQKNDPRKNLKVLDVGCGAGQFLRWCSKIGHDVVGAEVSKNIVDQLKEKGFNVLNKSLQQLSKQEIQYDWVVCIDVIEHLKEPLKALEQLAKLIKPGGQLAIQTPNGNAIAKYGENTYSMHVDIEHLNYFRPKQLINSLKKHGLKLVCLKYSPRDSGSGRANVFLHNKTQNNQDSVGLKKNQPYAKNTKARGIRKIINHFPPQLRGIIRSSAQLSRWVASSDEIFKGTAHEFFVIMCRPWAGEKCVM